jgi:cytochrome c oxidase subunit II
MPQMEPNGKPCGAALQGLWRAIPARLRHLAFVVTLAASVNNCRMPLSLVFLAAGSNLWFDTIKTVRASNGVRFGMGVPEMRQPSKLGRGRLKKSFMPAIFASLAPTAALAAQPDEWGYRFQEAATGMMGDIAWFERYTLWFIIPITLFVLVLLIYVSWRFSEKRNPVPSKTSHNSLIEVIWTVGPVVILLLIAIPSFQLLTAQLTPPVSPALTVKATGYQWYWGYEYQAEADPLSIESRLVPDADRAPLGKEDIAAYPRLLTVDNEMVVPVGETVRLIATGNDVIHAFAMPAFGLKMDAIPGRLNETWFKPEKEGVFYGQCSEICGKDHAYMPIAIRVVSKAKYDAWYAAAKTDLPGANKTLMAATDSKPAVEVAGN